VLESLPKTNALFFFETLTPLDSGRQSFIITSVKLDHFLLIHDHSPPQLLANLELFCTIITSASTSEAEREAGGGKNHESTLQQPATESGVCRAQLKTQ
jgi:hypothetical protein